MTETKEIRPQMNSIITANKRCVGDVDVSKVVALDDFKKNGSW